MATKTDHIDQFRAFIQRLCDTDVPSITADGKWHRFRIADTRHKGSKPGAYLLHTDGKANGIFVDWRDGKRHKWFAEGPVEHVDREEIDRKRKERQAEIYAKLKAGSANSLAFWKVCAHKPEGSHQYLDTKKIPGAFHGARIGNHPAFGLGNDPLLIIPIRNVDPKLATLQAIRGDGQRRFFSGTTHDGGYTIIGDIKAGIIALCEGFGTGVTIHQATGWAVIVCITSGNMERIARWAGHAYAGREFIVCGDDDAHLEDKPSGNVGRKKATHAARILGAKLAFPDMQGVEGSDFNDQAAEYGVNDVSTTLLAALDEDVPEPEADAAPEPEYYEGPMPEGYEAEPEEKPELPRLALFSPADWTGKAVPERDWRLDSLIPNGQATLFTGAGAVGKSLATQQLSTCIAMGLPFLGVATKAVPAVYVTCEDDLDELHRRQVAICHGLGITVEATRGRLFLLSLAGEIGNELGAFDGAGTMKVAPRYVQLVTACNDVGASHITLDNTAHFFSGNENDRHQVATFMSLVNRMARDIDGSAVVVGHPNKAGDSYSGSTAWENQVRSRIFMETPVGGDGVPANPDLRVIRNEKANYAQKGSEIRFMWVKGAFIQEDVILADDRAQHQETVQMGRDNQLFLQLLDQLTREKRNVSHSPNSGLFAPKVMAGMTEAKGVTRPRFHAAMERLLLRELIVASQPVWIGKDRHPVIGIARKQPEKSHAA